MQATCRKLLDNHDGGDCDDDRDKEEVGVENINDKW